MSCHVLTVEGIPGTATTGLGRAISQRPSPVVARASGRSDLGLFQHQLGTQLLKAHFA